MSDSRDKKSEDDKKSEELSEEELEKLIQQRKAKAELDELEKELEQEIGERESGSTLTIQTRLSPLVDVIPIQVTNALNEILSELTTKIDDTLREKIMQGLQKIYSAAVKNAKRRNENPEIFIAGIVDLSQPKLIESFLLNQILIALSDTKITISPKIIEEVQEKLNLVQAKLKDLYKDKIKIANAKRKPKEMEGKSEATIIAITGGEIEPTPELTRERAMATESRARKKPRHEKVRSPEDSIIDYLKNNIEFFEAPFIYPDFQTWAAQQNNEEFNKLSSELAEALRFQPRAEQELKEAIAEEALAQAEAAVLKSIEIALQEFSPGDPEYLRNIKQAIQPVLMLKPSIAENSMENSAKEHIMRIMQDNILPHVVEEKLTPDDIVIMIRNFISKAPSQPRKTIKKVTAEEKTQIVPGENQPRTRPQIVVQYMAGGARTTDMYLYVDALAKLKAGNNAPMKTLLKSNRALLMAIIAYKDAKHSVITGWYRHLMDKYKDKDKNKDDHATLIKLGTHLLQDACLHYFAKLKKAYKKPPNSEYFLNINQLLERNLDALIKEWQLAEPTMKLFKLLHRLKTVILVALTDSIMNIDLSDPAKAAITLRDFAALITKAKPFLIGRAADAPKTMRGKTHGALFLAQIQPVLKQINSSTPTIQPPRGPSPPR